MSLALQQFGKIETELGPANAMLSIDADRPTEFMIQWWNEKVPGLGVLSDVRSSGNDFELIPRLLYKVTDGGALYPPKVRSKEENEAFSVTSARLKKTILEGFEGEWTTTTGKKGYMSFAAPLPSPTQGASVRRCGSWEDFKGWANQVRTNQPGCWFRGQGCSSFSLSSTLHRLGRTRLERYCFAELQQFADNAQAVLNMRLDLKNPNDYAIILGLAQHHGLPTPLVDWTASPYIAAFFAFSDAIEAVKSRPNSTHVRIFSLSAEFIHNTAPEMVVVPHVKPYTCSLVIAPLHNPRLYAQQGRFLVTNVANLESWLHFGEQSLNKQMLTAADVPVEFAAEALEELAFMGLSAATMFPGLDGVSRMIRHEMSFKQHPASPKGDDEVSQSTEPKAGQSIPLSAPDT